MRLLISLVHPNRCGRREFREQLPARAARRGARRERTAQIEAPQVIVVSVADRRTERVPLGTENRRPVLVLDIDTGNIFLALDPKDAAHRELRFRDVGTPGDIPRQLDGLSRIGRRIDLEEWRLQRRRKRKGSRPRVNMGICRLKMGKRLTRHEEHFLRTERSRSSHGDDVGAFKRHGRRPGIQEGWNSEGEGGAFNAHAGYPRAILKKQHDGRRPGGIRHARAPGCLEREMTKLMKGVVGHFSRVVKETG